MKKVVERDCQAALFGPSSWKRTVHLGMAFFLVISSHYIFKSVSGGLVIARLSAFGIPRIDLLDSLASLLLCLLLYSVPRLRRRLSGFAIPLLMAGAALFLAFPVIYSRWQGPQAPVLILLSLVGTSLCSLGVYLSWMLFTSTVATKRWTMITVFGACAQGAVIVGTSGANLWMGRHAALPLLQVSAVGYGVAALLFFRALRRFPCFSTAEIEELPKAGRRPEMARSPLTSSFFLAMLGLIAAQIAFRQILQWRVFVVAEGAGNTAQEASLSLATFYRLQGMLSLASQCLLVPVIFRYFSPIWTICIQPICGLLAIASIAIASDASALIALIAIYSSLDYTVNNCVRESLFVEHGAAMKIFAKTWLAILLPKLASMAGSASILAVKTYGIRSWYLFGTFFAAGGLLAAQSLAAMHRKEREPEWLVTKNVDTAADAARDGHMAKSA
jgi:hypothetical protein